MTNSFEAPDTNEIDFGNAFAVADKIFSDVKGELEEGGRTVYLYETIHTKAIKPIDEAFGVVSGTKGKSEAVKNLDDSFGTSGDERERAQRIYDTTANTLRAAIASSPNSGILEEVKREFTNRMQGYDKREKQLF